MPTGMRDYDRWDGSEQTFLDTDDFSIVCIPNYISYQRFLFSIQDLVLDKSYARTSLATNLPILKIS